MFIGTPCRMVSKYQNVGQTQPSYTGICAPGNVLTFLYAVNILQTLLVQLCGLVALLVFFTLKYEKKKFIRLQFRNSKLRKFTCN